MGLPIGMSGDDAYALLRKYVKDTLDGAGALKGKSAYELAVQKGFVGTLEEYLASLKGKDGSGAGFDYEQTEAADTWTITHSLGNQYPNVLCVDEDGNVIVGDIEYYSANVTIIRFGMEVKGSAHLTQSGGSGAGGEGMPHAVMDRSEYDALAVKDPDTIYLIRG